MWREREIKEQRDEIIANMLNLTFYSPSTETKYTMFHFDLLQCFCPPFSINPTLKEPFFSSFIHDLI